MIIRVHGINLFRLVQSIIILSEIGEVASLESIKSEIFRAIRPKWRQLFESKDSNPLKARILLIIDEMTELIFEAVQKTALPKTANPAG